MRTFATRVEIPVDTVPDFNTYPEEPPTDGQVHLERARFCMAQQRYGRAIVELTYAAYRMPNEPAVYSARAQAYYHRHQLRDAYADLSYLLDHLTQSAELFYQRGCIARDLGEITAALDDFDAAAALHDADSRIFFARGQMYWHVGNLSNAKVNFDRAIALDATNPASFFARGQIYRRQAAYDLALADFERTLLLDPTHGSAHYFRGVIFYEVHDWDQARAAFRQTVQTSTTPAERRQATESLAVMEQRFFRLRQKIDRILTDRFSRIFGA